MVSFKTIFTLFERFGVVNTHRYHLPWPETVQNLYVNFASTFFLFHILCHLFSTLTRATRYLPEFFQTILEDCIIIFLLFAVLYFRWNYRTANEIADIVENFSEADSKIVEKCHRLSTRYFVMFMSALFIAICGSFAESLLPITESELGIRARIYRTAHPERRLPYPLRLPFIDETVTPNYEILYFLDIFIMVYFTIWAGLIVTVAPIVSIWVRGQYEILGEFVAKIGHPHRDADGNEILYVNIEKNIKMNACLLRNGEILEQRKRRNLRWEYERDFVGQVLRFHMKLDNFKEKVGKTKYIHCIFL